MFNKFKLRGNVSIAIRSDEEMASVDKEAADNSFKYQKKKLDLFLQQKGFVKYKTNSYARRNSVNVLEYINLQKEQYGSKTFTVNYALIPLYVPHSFLSYDLGDRLGKLICDRDVWWDYSNKEIAEVSFQNLIDAIDIYLMPWFDKMTSNKMIKKELFKEKKNRESYGGRLSDIQQSWLEAIDSGDDFTKIVNANISTLKLPNKLH